MMCMLLVQFKIKCVSSLTSNMYENEGKRVTLHCVMILKKICRPQYFYAFFYPVYRWNLRLKIQ